MPSTTTLFNDLAISTLTDGTAAKAELENKANSKHPVLNINSLILGNYLEDPKP
jgi:hypothetical protein